MANIMTDNTFRLILNVCHVCAQTFLTIITCFTLIMIMTTNDDKCNLWQLVINDYDTCFKFLLPSTSQGFCCVLLLIFKSGKPKKSDGDVGVKNMTRGERKGRTDMAILGCDRSTNWDQTHWQSRSDWMSEREKTLFELSHHAELLFELSHHVELLEKQGPMGNLSCHISLIQLFLFILQRQTFKYIYTYIWNIEN